MSNGDQGEVGSSIAEQLGSVVRNAQDTFGGILEGLFEEVGDAVQGGQELLASNVEVGGETVRSITQSAAESGQKPFVTAERLALAAAAVLAIDILFNEGKGISAVTGR